jgi:NAD-dependent deacetylase
MNFDGSLIERLRTARKIAVLTGAGISAESGVPTFRDAQTGIWASFDPEELATPEAFRRNPERVWSWYQSRRESMAQVQPNPGHYALALWEMRATSFSIATQNIDGLHHRAGSRTVYEIHGNIHRTKCFQENAIVDSWMDDGSVPPRCPRCGGWLRPDVVWFGEMLPASEMEKAQDDALICDVYLSIGTSAIVYPAAGLPMMARGAGKTLVEINPESTPLTPSVDFFLKGKSGEILPELVRSVFDVHRNIMAD